MARHDSEITAGLEEYIQDVEDQIAEEARQEAAMAAQNIEDAEEAARRRTIINGADPDNNDVAYETVRKYDAAVNTLRPLKPEEAREYFLIRAIIGDNQHEADNPYFLRDMRDYLDDAPAPL